MLRPSVVPPEPIRQLRDLTRYRVDLLAARTSDKQRIDKQRIEKLLEDAQIKLSVVASDSFGASGRAMLAALIAGERDPAVLAELAELAKRRLRAKKPQLRDAFVGRFNDHHAFLLATMLERIDRTSADIASVEATIQAQIAPFAHAVAQLDEITGIGHTAACAIIAEIGIDMTRFPTAGPSGLLGPLCTSCEPVVNQSGNRASTKATGHGNRYLARVLGEAAVTAGRTNTFLGERYRRIARRRGARRAIVAVGRSILIIIWHLLANPDARYQDLGADFFATRIDTQRRKRNHVRQLEALGYTLTLQPAA